MTKTAQTKTAHSGTVELEVFLSPRVHYMNDVHSVRFREMKFRN